MGIPFTILMGFLLTMTMGILFTITIGIQLTIYKGNSYQLKDKVKGSLVKEREAQLS